MAYARRTSSHSGLTGSITKQTDNKFAWVLKENCTSDELNASTSGSLNGTVELASGADLVDYDSAATALKTAWNAAG